MLGPAFGNLAIALVSIVLLAFMLVLCWPVLIALGARLGFWGDRRADAADLAVEEERRRHEYLREEAKWREEHRR